MEPGGSAPYETRLAVPSNDFSGQAPGRDGHIAAVFATAIEPTAPRAIAAIEKELAGA